MASFTHLLLFARGYLATRPPHPHNRVSCWDWCLDHILSAHLAVLRRYICHPSCDCGHQWHTPVATCAIPTRSNVWSLLSKPSLGSPSGVLNTLTLLNLLRRRCMTPLSTFFELLIRPCRGANVVTVHTERYGISEFGGPSSSRFPATAEVVKRILKTRPATPDEFSVGKHLDPIRRHELGKHPSATSGDAQPSVACLRWVRLGRALEARTWATSYFFRRRLWLRKRDYKSRLVPPDRDGIGEIGSATKVGARKKEYRPTPSPGRPFLGPNPADRTPGKPWGVTIFDAHLRDEGVSTRSAHLPLKRRSGNNRTAKHIA